MSNPYRKPENAATAAPVSPQGVAAGPSSAAAAAATTRITTGSPSSSSATLTGSSSISDHARQAASASPAVPEPPVSHVPSTTSTTSTLSSSLAVNHGDQNNKKSRPPTVLHQRPNGPSLLTQALASARGISFSNVSQTDQRHPEQKPGQPNEQSQPSQPKNVYEASTGHAVIKSQDEPREQSEQSPLKPTSQPRLAEATRAISPPSFSSATYPTPDTTTTPWPVTMPSTTSTTTTLITNRDFDVCTRGRGRSLERTEKEIRLRLSNLPLTHSDNIGDTSFSHTSSGTDDDPSTDDTSELLADPRVQYRAWRVDRTLSMGPEKAWSIGTNDVIGHQDGQVEKSITEVLAGVEPTRSRKASHSLRFFKEGLPEEKGRRRESKSVGHQREKSLLAEELLTDVHHQKHPDQYYALQTSTPSPQSAEGDQSSSHFSTVQPLPLGSSISESVLSYGTAELDYFGLQGPQEHVVADSVRASSPREQLAAKAGVHGAPNVSAVVSEENTAQVHRKSSDATEMGEHTEEGDESSEEKISSAVFLPHQGLDQSSPHRDVLPKEFKVQQPASRKPQGEDFHPWLVKADEPEAEDGARADGPDGGNVNRNNDTAPHVEEFPRIDDECAVEDEVESPQKSRDISTMSSRPVSQYYEDMVHEHQLGPKLPLEAIELIPYKHQVGGHTTIWRFSKRAVCKQLNNRENEFYEKIERYHRDLLPFLPRCVNATPIAYLVSCGFGGLYFCNVERKQTDIVC